MWNSRCWVQTEVTSMNDPMYGYDIKHDKIIAVLKTLDYVQGINCTAIKDFQLSL